MPLVRSKQISKFVSGRVFTGPYILGGASTSMDVTATLTTALATASDQGTAVPLQAMTAGTAEGLYTLAPKNLVEIYDRATGQKIANTAGDGEVFGRLTEAAGVWTVSFFETVAGAEVAFSVDVLTLDAVIPYYFTFEHLPADFAISLKTAYTNDDPASASRVASEVLTVSPLNVLSPLSQTYLTGGKFELNVNGQVVDILTNSFTAAGTTVTWDQLVAGYALDLTDSVVATYAF